MPNPGRFEAAPTGLMSNLRRFEAAPTGLMSNRRRLEATPTGLTSNRRSLEAAPTGLVSNHGRLEAATVFYTKLNNGMQYKGVTQRRCHEKLMFVPKKSYMAYKLKEKSLLRIVRGIVFDSELRIY
jgi:hypothetical protein